MNGWLKWLPWLRKPVFVPGYKPTDPAPDFAAKYVRPTLQEFDECDCGRAHPRGWVCCSTFRDQL